VSSELHTRDKDDARCPQCSHLWVTHGSVPDANGSVPDANGCMLIMSSVAARAAMFSPRRRTQAPGRATGIGRPARLPRSASLRLPRAARARHKWDKRLVREDARQRELYGYA
jgi:hypothetical protein